MTTPFLVRGDKIPQILDDGPPPTDAPRGLVWGLDLTGCTSKAEAKARWHTTRVSIKNELDERPSIRKVCVACVRPTTEASSSTRIPQGFAPRLHNDLERDRARYLQTLVLDVTTCESSERLHERLTEAMCTTNRSWNDLTLEWSDVAECGFLEAWRRDSL